MKLTNSKALRWLSTRVKQKSIVSTRRTIVIRFRTKFFQWNKFSFVFKVLKVLWTKTTAVTFSVRSLVFSVWCFFRNKTNVRNSTKVNSNEILKNLFELFRVKFSFSGLENIVWKRYMPGWREVCDECATTLFNHHYMCRECGLMICIECFDQFSQIPLEKRRSSFSFEKKLIRSSRQSFLPAFRIEKTLPTRKFFSALRIHSVEK